MSPADLVTFMLRVGLCGVVVLAVLVAAGYVAIEVTRSDDEKKDRDAGGFLSPAVPDVEVQRERALLVAPPAARRGDRYADLLDGPGLPYEDLITGRMRCSRCLHVVEDCGCSWGRSA